MPEWLTVKEAAAYLKIHRTTLYDLCVEGKLPFHELPGERGRRFKREELDRMLRPGRHEELSMAIAAMVQDAEAGRLHPDDYARLREIGDELTSWTGLEVYDPGSAGWVRRARAFLAALDARRASETEIRRRP